MRYPARRSAVASLGFLILGFVLGDLYGGYIDGLLTVAVAFLLGISLGTVIDLFRMGYTHFTAPLLEYQGVRYNESGTYFLRVENKVRGNEAHACHGLLAVLGTPRTDLDTVWEHNEAPRYLNILTYADLRLFQIMEPTDHQGGSISYRSIIFASANKDFGFKLSPRYPLEECTDEVVRVTLGASDGRLPKKPYEKKVTALIKEAIKQEAV